ncbi:hypothetical protein QR680_016632 [Steinernema hermaphroditum]|uniref:Poly(A) RNA polymerase mitochondrial-like central palm domain-containing protein n=1 Tax=Steinernema hermaphroditum TaxID=289476 RepID=A0AA39HBT7_9BILA|nr:hypothetical protein QR680_016632 [Steinernema hermaphroditum]
MSKETISCEICMCVVPSPESLEIHKVGKRHKKLQAVWETMKALSERSIFLSGLHHGFDEDLIKLEMEKHFGAVERVIRSKQKTTSGVVEFIATEIAQKALETKRIQIGSDEALIAKRLMSMDKVEEANKKLIEMDRLIEEIRHGSDYEQQIGYLIDKYAISEEEIRVRHEAMTKLVACLKDYFSDEVDIILFGSSITGLGIKSSDADAALVFTSGSLRAAEHQNDSLGRDKMTLLTCDVSMFQSRKIQRGEFARLSTADRVRLMAKVLNDVRKRYGYFQNQKPIVDARCPLVRFTFENRIPFDLSVDNQLSATKSQWLKSVVDRSHPMIRRFLFGLRIWAQSNGLFDSHGLPKGFFNSYMLNALAINFLQMKHYISPHIIVTADNAEEHEVKEWNLNFGREALNEIGDVKLPQLFKEFFVFCIQTDHKSFVHVVRKNEIVSVEEFKATITDKRVAEGFKFGMINVQDPIELSHNVTMNIVHNYLALMRQKMMLSLAKLKHTPKGKEPNFADILSVDYEGHNITDLSNKSNESEVMINLHEKVGDVCNALDSIFNGILLCNTVSEFDPPAKRRCVDGNMNERSSDVYERRFEAHFPIWLGRRNLRRSLADLQGNFVRLESTVSKKIAEKSRVEETLAFSVSAVVSSERILSVSMQKVAGSEKDYHDFTHFLHVSGFLQRCMDNTQEAMMC